ncbi:MAG: hypothetical protein V7713_08445 [Marinobacter sp.]
MSKSDTHEVNVARQQMVKNLSGSMAAISSTVLILAVDGKLLTNGVMAFYIIATALSVPMLIFSMLMAYQLLEEKEVPEKSFNYSTIVFSFGVASAMTGYLLLLATASLWTLPGFLAGTAIGGYFYVKSHNLIVKS